MREAAGGSELELSAAEMRELVEQAMQRIVPFVESLPEQPSYATEEAVELALSLVDEPLPRSGTPFPELLDLLFGKLIPATFNTAGPGYLAYIPGGGLFHTAVADLISDAVNRYVGVFAAAPGLAQLEANVIRWFCEIMGYPAEARGVLTSGGSLANFSAVVTARRDRLGDDFSKGTVYASDQIHHSVLKACLLAGIPESRVRPIPSDERFRMRPDALREAIAADRRDGWTPFLVAASAGTTNTGAVDPLQELAALCAADGLWLHVDAAYGGFFRLTEQGRRIMRGIEKSDSITLDPHKGLFLPYGTGSLLVRDGQALRRAHAVQGSYMPPLQDDPRLVDFCEISPELSRSFRGLRVWLPLRLHGIEPFRRNLEEKLELSRWAAQQLETVPGIEIVAHPQLSVTAFRYHRQGCTEEQSNDLNRRLMQGVNERKRVYLTHAWLGGRFVVRICVVSFRTHLDRLRACLEDIRSEVARLEQS